MKSHRTTDFPDSSAHLAPVLTQPHDTLRLVHQHNDLAVGRFAPIVELQKVIFMSIADGGAVAGGDGETILSNQIIPYPTFADLAS